MAKKNGEPKLAADLVAAPLASPHPREKLATIEKRVADQVLRVYKK